MARERRQPTYEFYVHKNGVLTNVNDLTPEEQAYVKTWTYQTLVRGLGYEPVKEHIN